jgi:hypothetical protein
MNRVVWRSVKRLDSGIKRPFGVRLSDAKFYLFMNRLYMLYKIAFLAKCFSTLRANVLFHLQKNNSERVKLERRSKNVCFCSLKISLKLRWQSCPVPSLMKKSVTRRSKTMVDTIYPSKFQCSEHGWDGIMVLTNKLPT